MVDRKFSLGVLVCIFNKDFSKIILLKRNEEKRNKGGANWGNVGGRVELGEMSIDAGLREAREEIGINLNPEKLKLIEIKEMPNFTDIFHAVQFVYATTIDENEKIILNFNCDNESEEYRWFSLDCLPDKMFDSKEYIFKLSILAKKSFLEIKN